MGREVAEAVPEAMAVFERGSEACGLDLKRLCFETPLEEMVETEVQQPALVATSLAMLAALRVHGVHARLRDRAFGRRVRGAGRRRVGRRRRRRSRSSASAGLAMAEAAKERPGSMAAILGLDDEVVERLCRRILGVWPANYNCPGQIVVSGENEAVDELLSRRPRRRARAARSSCKVSGAFHSPLVARAAERLRPAVEAVKFGEPQAAFMSTVTARFEEAQRMGALLVDQLTAPVRFTQAAGELVKDGVKTFVEVGPGNVLSGLMKRIDRSVKAVSVNGLASLEKLKELRCSTGVERLLLARGEAGAGHRRVPRDRARDRAGARARRGVRRRRLPQRAPTRPRRSPPRSAAAPSRPTSRAPRRQRASSRRRATSTSSSTTRA